MNRARPGQGAENPKLSESPTSRLVRLFSPNSLTKTGSSLGSVGLVGRFFHFDLDQLGFLLANVNSP